MNKMNHNSSVSGGIFLIGLGILIYSGWWWPGILLVMGLASSAELILRGKYISALLTFAFFASIPFFVAADIPWNIVGPFVLITMGVAVLVKNLTGRQSENNH